MEQKNLLLVSWEQQKKVFTDNLVASRKRPTMSSVHDLRVAIKKMRSYLRLKKHLKAEKWKETFSNVLALFKSFGTAADFDMSIVILRRVEHKKLLSFPFLKEDLFVNRTLSRKRARQDAINFNEKDLDVFDEQFNFDIPHEELCKKIIERSLVKMKKVNVLVKHFRKNAHEIRKQLKDVHNWVRISPRDFDKKFISIEALDQMLKHLGARQDHFVLRQKIGQYIKDLPENEEKTNLKAIEKTLKGIEDNFLDKAKEKWKEVKHTGHIPEERTPN